MTRSRSWFTLDGVARAHALDDVQAVLLKDCAVALNALCPDGQAPPAALHELHLAICLLADWTSRTDRGRARLRARYLKIIEGMEQKLASIDANTEQQPLLQVAPALLRSVIAADDKETDAASGAELADEVEAWLASGDD